MVVSIKRIAFFLLVAFGTMSCTKYEHAKSVTLYDFHGSPNVTFEDVTILEQRSNYIYFVTDADNKATKHNGRYTIEK